MKTAAEIANHPRAILVRRVVDILRATGSPAGAAEAWRRLPEQERFWPRLELFGLTNKAVQAQLTCIAFPPTNRADVDAALAAANRLRQIYELACDTLSLARDPASRTVTGRKGLKTIRPGEVARPSGSTSFNSGP